MLKMLPELNELNGWICKIQPEVVDVVGKKTLLQVQIFIVELQQISNDTTIDLYNKIDQLVHQLEKTRRSNLAFVPTEAGDFHITCAVCRRVEDKLKGSSFGTFPNIQKTISRLGDWLNLLAYSKTKNPIWV